MAFVRIWQYGDMFFKYLEDKSGEMAVGANNKWERLCL